MPTSTSEAVWGSWSCPRALRHAGQGNHSSNLLKTLALPLSHSLPFTAWNTWLESSLHFPNLCASQWNKNYINIYIYIFTRWTRLPAVAYQCNPWNISKETLFTFRQLFLLPLYLYQSQAASIYLSGPKRSGVALMREYLTTQLKKKKKQLGWNAGGKKRKRKMLLLITEGFLASF